jgi:hypothetical protein
MEEILKTCLPGCVQTAWVAHSRKAQLSSSFGVQAPLFAALFGKPEAIVTEVLTFVLAERTAKAKHEHPRVPVGSKCRPLRSVWFSLHRCNSGAQAYNRWNFRAKRKNFFRS